MVGIPMRRLFISLAIVLLSACVSPAPKNAAPHDTPPASALPVVRVDPDHALGSSTASIAIVEFADYQCPYCRGFHAQTFPKLKSAYIDSGKARFFYKDFPLRIHPHAFPASVVAYCAGAQQRYWPMQDLLYDNQERLGEVLYVKLAEELKLDIKQFNACRRSGAAFLAIRRDVADGYRLGINGTPSFILGRIHGDRVIVQRMATGTPSFETFAQELDALNR